MSKITPGGTLRHSQRRWNLSFPTASGVVELQTGSGSFRQRRWARWLIESPSRHWPRIAALEIGVAPGRSPHSNFRPTPPQPHP